MPIKQFTAEYEEGDMVNFKTDFQKYPLIVIGYYVRGCDVLYCLSLNGEDRGMHYGYELEKWKGEFNLIMNE